MHNFVVDVDKTSDKWRLFIEDLRLLSAIHAS